MRAAFQIGFAQARFGKPRAHRLDMARFAIVRGAGHRDMLNAEAEALDRAAFDERQRLNGLGRRARQDRRVDVAPGLDHRAIRLHDRRCALVAAFIARPPARLRTVPGESVARTPSPAAVADARWRREPSRRPAPRTCFARPSASPKPVAVEAVEPSHAIRRQPTRLLTSSSRRCRQSSPI